MMILMMINYIKPIVVKQMGGNSKLEHWAITRTLDNGKLNIHESFWEKVKFIGSGSFGRVYHHPISVNLSPC